MTPSEVAGITAIATIVKEIGTWPVVLVLAILQLAPWVVMLWISRSMEKRHGEALQMYENNVILVKEHADLVEDYDAATKRWENITETVISVVSLNTQAQTKLLDSIRSNEFCPVVRNTGPNRS